MTIQEQDNNIGDCLSSFAHEMRDVMTNGHMDRFNTLAKRRNHLLQWLAGMTPGPVRNIAPSPDRPDPARCAALFRQAVEENQSLTQHARLCMAETHKKIAGLTLRRQSQNKLSNVYSAHSQGMGLSARM